MSQLDPAFLAANPQFAQLHNHLVTSLLTPNGQTASLDRSVSRQETHETANKRHVQRAKTKMLQKGLRAIAFDADNGFHSAERERCLLAAEVLRKGSLSTEEGRLIEADINHFRDDLESKDPGRVGVAQSLNQYFEEQREVLIQMASASGPPHTSSSKTLESLTTILQGKLSALEELNLRTIPALNAKLAENTSELQAFYRELIELEIQHLERHTHGIKLRSSKAQAEYLSTVSAGMAAKAKILLLQTRQEIYDDQVQEALENYAGHLSILEERLRERQRQLEEESRLFEDQGERRMRECGKRYIAVNKEIEDVKAEIARLKPNQR